MKSRTEEQINKKTKMNVRLKKKNEGKKEGKHKAKKDKKNLLLTSQIDLRNISTEVGGDIN